eukprot:scaffold36267_cov58-Phaeocystis_antarctica.AAC.4
MVALVRILVKGGDTTTYFSFQFSSGRQTGSFTTEHRERNAQRKPRPTVSVTERCGSVPHMRVQAWCDAVATGPFFSPGYRCFGCMWPGSAADAIGPLRAAPCS